MATVNGLNVMIRIIRMAGMTGMQVLFDWNYEDD